MKFKVGDLVTVNLDCGTASSIDRPGMIIDGPIINPIHSIYSSQVPLWKVYYEWGKETGETWVYEVRLSKT